MQHEWNFKHKKKLETKKNPMKKKSKFRVRATLKGFYYTNRK